MKRALFTNFAEIVRKNVPYFLFTLALLAGIVLFFSSGQVPVQTVLAPDSDRSHITFFALGDQGNGGRYQKNIAKAMNKVAESRRDINFTVFLGDNFYPEGVSSVNDDQWMTKFESVYNGAYLQGMPFYAILGNHDHRDNPQAQIDYSSLELGSRRWKMDSYYYFKEFGKFDGRPLLGIVFIDTVNFKEWKKQEELIKAAFANGINSPKWKIIAGHDPVRSFGDKHGDNDQLKKRLLPLMKSIGVDVYLSGHDHLMQVIDYGNEPLYVVSGAGGKSLYNLKKRDSALRYGESKYGFALLIADPSRLSIEFYNEEGLLEYHMEIPEAL